MKLTAAFFSLTTSLCCSALSAAPSDKVFMPEITRGEKSLEVGAGSARDPGGERESSGSVSVGYGLTDRWFAEFALGFQRDYGQGTRLDSLEIENRFLLHKSETHSFDLGLLLEIERPLDHAQGWGVKWGPLFQTEVGKTQLNLNLLFERSYRADTPRDTKLGYQWQVKYPCLSNLEFGLQGFGEMGKWNDWSDGSARQHRVGPAIFSSIPLGAEHGIHWNAGWMIGASPAAPQHTFRLQIEHAF